MPAKRRPVTAGIQAFIKDSLSLTFNLNSIHIRLYVAYSLIDLIST
jgi:hypothetical protein